ncbi:hypothetical protein [uncultured Ferrimonas sp.]|uniref:hypothetical protein n=1 Tax=uncultured Ferrimonas sp. TaxID=432640 RepID=UPI0026091CAB|nr:hypothetical protein [uncultured Ferrimonas sp.]
MLVIVGQLGSASLDRHGDAVANADQVHASNVIHLDQPNSADPHANDVELCAQCGCHHAVYTVLTAFRSAIAVPTLMHPAVALVYSPPNLPQLSPPPTA